MPNAPRTPIRGIRIPDDLWADAQAEAECRGEDVSTAIRHFLKNYTRPQRTGVRAKLPPVEPGLAIRASDRDDD